MSLSWLWHPIAVAVLITLGGLIFKKFVEAYVSDIQRAVEARRECSKRVLNILALCSNLEGVSSIEHPSLQGERERWIGQLDEATCWLMDNWQWFALTYAGALGLRDLMAGYAGVVRGEWLSDHPLERRVRRIRELTERVQTIYFARRPRSAGRAVKELREMIG